MLLGALVSGTAAFTITWLQPRVWEGHDPAEATAVASRILAVLEEQRGTDELKVIQLAVASGSPKPSKAPLTGALAAMAGLAVATGIGVAVEWSGDRRARGVEAAR